jgi:hypothetical protein
MNEFPTKQLINTTSMSIRDSYKHKSLGVFQGFWMNYRIIETECLQFRMVISYLVEATCHP